LRFGNDLEGRRLRRPRYRAENNPSLVIGEDFGETSTSSVESLSRAAPGRRKRLPSKFFARLSHRLRDTLGTASLLAVMARPPPSIQERAPLPRQAVIHPFPLRVPDPACPLPSRQVCRSVPARSCRLGTSLSAKNRPSPIR